MVCLVSDHSSATLHLSCDETFFCPNYHLVIIHYLLFFKTNILIFYNKVNEQRGNVLHSKQG